MHTLLPQLFDQIFLARKPWAKKGDAGKVFIVSGSEEYSGSPIFNAVAALRLGADLVNVVGHPRAMQITASYAPDIITIPLSGELTPWDVPMILKRAERFTSLLIGCGLARSEETHQAIRMIIEGVALPIVLDAEALHAIVGHTEILKGKQILLTPNAHEFIMLTGESVLDKREERSAQVLRWADKLQVVILLKGHIDSISNGIDVDENITGTPFMAKGGFGDTLAGIAAALMARGVSPYDAGRLGAWINGCAGEYASADFGEGLLASDMLSYLPKVLMEHTHQHH